MYIGDDITDYELSQTMIQIPIVQLFFRASNGFQSPTSN